MSNATKSAKTTGAEAEEAESEPLISVGDYDGVAPGPRLKLRYNAELRDQIQTALGLENVMEVPRLTKIVVNVGAGAHVDHDLGEAGHLHDVFQPECGLDLVTQLGVVAQLQARPGGHTVVVAHADQRLGLGFFGLGAGRFGRFGRVAHSSPPLLREIRVLMPSSDTR